MTSDVTVAMVPYKFAKGESGIRRVVEAYKRYLPEYGINLVQKK